MFSDEEITTLFRVRRTVLQMLRDRGYLVGNSEINMNRADFIAKFGETIKRDDLTILKAKPDNPTDQVYVFFPEEEKIGIKSVKNYIARMKNDNVFKAILVVRKVTPSAKKGIQELSATYQINFFEEEELLVNITHHELVPQHQVLSNEEKLALLKQYTVKEIQVAFA
ncbi:hypothetical protein GIB67_019930 [Kingdonia uniflora]|uniref:Uncharacterized protein n=1 Tax=Kingdonia uniflora TaxID=39325 RepID=A0A7J7MKT1_9MAGN|nr:hypothetical protein GIB67_019930 [Kingdonia uniflora]